MAPTPATASGESRRGSLVVEFRNCFFPVRKTAKIFRGFVLAAALLGGGADVVGADTVESVHRLAVELAKLKEEKARLETDWVNERELIQATIPAVQERLQLLEQKRKLAEEQTAAGRQDAEKEARKSAELSASLEQTTERLRGATRLLLQLRPSLPPRLSRALELPFASLEDAAISPAERMRSVITVLDRCSQFNAAVTLSEETLIVDGAKEKLVEVLYWGLASGYALDRSGRQAYVGRPGVKGWTWESKPEAVAEISAAIAIYRDETEPRFVTLPVRVDAKSPPAKGN